LEKERPLRAIVAMQAAAAAKCKQRPHGANVKGFGGWEMSDVVAKGN